MRRGLIIGLLLLFSKDGIFANSFCDGILRLASYQDPSLVADIRKITQTGEYIVMPGDKVNTIAKVDSIEAPRFDRPAKPIEYHRPLDLPYLVSKDGKSIFAVREFALNTPQHEIESRNKLWYKIEYEDAGNNVIAKISVLENEKETLIGSYSMSDSWLRTEAAKTGNVKLGAPARFEVNDAGFASLNYPPQFVSNIRTDLLPIVVEGAANHYRRAQ